MNKEKRLSVGLGNVVLHDQVLSEVVYELQYWRSDSDAPASISGSMEVVKGQVSYEDDSTWVLMIEEEVRFRIEIGNRWENSNRYYIRGEELKDKG